MDRWERQEKRNNIIITGLKNMQGQSPTNVKSAVIDFFTTELQQNVTVIDAFEIKLKSGQSKIIAKIGSFTEKIAIMKTRNLLKENVFFSDDLIKKDQFIQFKAREYAKAARKDNKEAKIGPGKVFIDGIMHVWDETTETFVTRKN